MNEEFELPLSAQVLETAGTADTAPAPQPVPIHGQLLVHQLLQHPPSTALPSLHVSTSFLHQLTGRTTTGLNNTCNTTPSSQDPWLESQQHDSHTPFQSFSCERGADLLLFKGPTDRTGLLFFFSFIFNSLLQTLSSVKPFFLCSSDNSCPLVFTYECLTSQLHVKEKKKFPTSSTASTQ